MTFEQYWTIVLKQWRLIIICFLVAGGGTVLGSKLITPVYQSTALIQIAIRSSNNPADYNSLLASDQLVQTEARLATSDPVLREVASHYPGLTVEVLSKEVAATPTVNTQLFEIDAIDPSPTHAAELANDIAGTLIKQQLQVFQQSASQTRQQIQGDLNTTQKQISNLAAQIAALQATGGNQPQIAVLQTQLSALQQHYNQSQTVLAQLEVAEVENNDILYIAQPAQPNFIPVRPNLLLNGSAGLLAGLFLGILLAILFERLDTRVRTPEALSQLLDWSVLTTIWRAGPKEAIVNPVRHYANVEAYRILRTNIGFAAIDRPLRTFIVTSALPGDGKSVVAANLAIFMAKAGKNTLLIDADLRRPVQNELFGLPDHTLGFSNAILAYSMAATANTPDYQKALIPKPTTASTATSVPRTLSLDPFVHRVNIPNLGVMPSGPLPPNPPELLDSKAIQHFISALDSSGVEVVIFDTPPLIGLSDSSILAPKVDGTLVVVDINRANKRNLKQVKAILMQSGARVLGCIVNKQRRGRADVPYSYYYSRDEKHGRRDRNKKRVGSPSIPSVVFNQSEVFDRDTVQTPTAPLVEKETPSQVNILDIRGGSQRENSR